MASDEIQAPPRDEFFTARESTLMHFGLLSAQRDIGREHWLEDGAFERVEIEIGPGSCGYLLAAAERAPRCLHVGIEIHSGSLDRVRRERSVPANVRLIDADGGWIVRHMLAPASIDAFHVYFPDPWWKKRHQKRRVFQDDFCQALARTLRPAGSAYVVTDVIPLFAEIRTRMEAAGFRADPWLRDPNDPACSSYERKYRHQRRHLEMAQFKLV